MMPDKIYVREYPDGINQFWDRKNRDDVVGVIYHGYIRKDALLEWVKKEMEEWSSESTTAQGVKMGLTLVIDKIESL